METQKCTKCGEVKPASGFSKAAGTESGLQNWCKDCHGAYAKHRYHGNKLMLQKSDMIEEICDYLQRTWSPLAHHKQDWLQNRKDASRIVESVLAIIKDTLVQGETVKISGFGKFDVKQKHQRKGRNPQTGEDILIPPRKVIRFYSSLVLRKALNQGHERLNGKIEKAKEKKNVRS